MVFVLNFWTLSSFFRKVVSFYEFKKKLTSWTPKTFFGWFLSSFLAVVTSFCRHVCVVEIILCNMALWILSSLSFTSLPPLLIPPPPLFVTRFCHGLTHHPNLLSPSTYPPPVIPTSLQHHAHPTLLRFSPLKHPSSLPICFCQPALPPPTLPSPPPSLIFTPSPPPFLHPQPSFLSMSCCRLKYEYAYWANYLYEYIIFVNWIMSAYWLLLLFIDMQRH